MSESGQRLALLASEYQSQLQAERVQTISTIGQLEQQRIKVDYQQRNLELRAPQAGRVKTLATTTLGAVVQPGTVLVSLVPRLRTAARRSHDRKPGYRLCAARATRCA